jgi:hypothetical protein
MLGRDEQMAHHVDVHELASCYVAGAERDACFGEFQGAARAASAEVDGCVPRVRVGS